MRRDGRSSTSLRELDIVLENLDRVDGSASFAFEETKALASVSGPIQVRLAAELPSKAAFEVSVRPLSGIAGVETKSAAATLRTLLTPSLVLTQNPRTLIQLVVQSLTPMSSPQLPNPSLTAAYINASTLALLRTASFPMLGVVCAAAVGRLKQIEGDERLLLDPTDEEIALCDAYGCVAIMLGSGSHGIQTSEIVWSSFQGAPLQADYDALLRLGKSGAESVYQAVRSKFQEEIDRGGVGGRDPPKKMPKFKGARKTHSTGAEEIPMDTT